MIKNAVYPKEVNWDRHTARLRTAKVEHICCVCRDSIPVGAKFYSVITWGAGLAGKKFPDSVHVEHMEEYRRR